MSSSLGFYTSNLAVKLLSILRLVLCQVLLLHKLLNCQALQLAAALVSSSLDLHTTNLTFKFCQYFDYFCVKLSCYTNKLLHCQALQLATTLVSSSLEPYTSNPIVKLLLILCLLLCQALLLHKLLHCQAPLTTTKATLESSSIYHGIRQ